MKRFLFVLILPVIFFSGCATARIPAYLVDQKPFTERFFTDHQRTLHAVQQALNELGWNIEQEMEPGIFEIQPGYSGWKKTLLITNVRIVGRTLVCHERMNIYVRSHEDISEVEIRIFKVKNWGIFKTKSFGNKKIAGNFFQLIQKNLEVVL